MSFKAREAPFFPSNSSPLGNASSRYCVDYLWTCGIQEATPWTKTKNSPAPMRFNSISQLDVPKGRDGKHKKIITLLLDDIAQLTPSSALKIPLAELPDTKENIRAALSRAAAQKKISIATSSNSEFLYVWKTNAGN